MATMSDDERKRFVQRVVRESIKTADGGNVVVTQDTSLGPSGLGHGCPLRQHYHPLIADRLKEIGCAMKNLAPMAFCAAEVVRVRDVTKLVLDSLQCKS